MVPVADSVTDVDAVLFDFSGTLYRLEEDDSWFEGMTLDTPDNKEVDAHVQAELVHRLTVPTGQTVSMTPEALNAWVNRDLAPTFIARPTCTCSANPGWPATTRKRCTPR